MRELLTTQAGNRQKMLQTFLLWLFLRLATSLGAGLSALFFPESARILKAQPIQEWLAHWILAPWNRWDVEWFLDIVVHDYQPGSGTLVFHPLYPVLARALMVFHLSPLLSLFLVSTFASLFFFITFYRLARLDLSEEDARVSVILLGFFPLSLILFAPYTEGLFLLCSAMCLYAARQRQWWLAGLAGALASLTRQQGLFLVLPLAWEFWVFHRPAWRALFRPQAAWAAPVLTAAGYLAWIGYRDMFFSEATQNISNVNELIYSFFISPSAVEVVPTQAFLPPWQTLWLAFQQFIAHPDLDMVLNLSISAWFLMALGFSWHNMPGSYRLYSLVITLVSLSLYTGPVHPLMGLPRHLFLAFPVFIGLAPSLKSPYLRLAWVGLGLLAMIALMLGYSSLAWVP